MVDGVLYFTKNFSIFEGFVIPAQAGIQVFLPLPEGEGWGEGFIQVMDSRLGGNDGFKVKTGENIFHLPINLGLRFS
jgi:hypothetical protein